MFRPLLKTKLLAAALFAAGVAAPALVVTAADAPPAAASIIAFNQPDPAAQLEDIARHFRGGDVTALVRALIPPTRWEEARNVYELHRQRPIPDEAREDFAAKLAELTGPEAIDQIIADLQPKFAEARAQWPGVQLMAFTAMSMAAESPDSELTESQREALRSVAPALQSWISSTDFLDENTLRQALELIAKGVRETGFDDLQQLHDLPLEALLERGASVLKAGKQAAGLYGLDLDAIADSYQVDVLELAGDSARVRSSVVLFGAPVWVDHDLVLVEGRWYGKAFARTWQQIESELEEPEGEAEVALESRS